MPVPDFLAEAAPEPPRADAIPKVMELVAELAEEQERQAWLEEQLESTKARITALTQSEIPDAMDQAGVDHLGVPGVGDIILKLWYHAVLPKEPEAHTAAVQWLMDNGHADLIKNELSIAFTRGEHNLAGEIKGLLESRLPDHPVSVREDVHHMTYTKFIREQVEAGEPVPLELLGARAGRVAQIKERKNS